VAAIDGDIKTADPSHPAFYLEGQEDTPNMRAFWALSAMHSNAAPGEKGMMCKANFECCSGFCVEGVCVDKQTQVCAGIGDACATVGECCNAAAVSCVGQALQGASAAEVKRPILGRVVQEMDRQMPAGVRIAWTRRSGSRKPPRRRDS